MRRFRWVRGVVVLGLAGAPVGFVPDMVSAVPGRARCRSIALVANQTSGSVSTIDLKTRTKDPTDIPVGGLPTGVAVTPDGKTAFVPNRESNAVSTINVNTRKKDPTDISVGGLPTGIAITPDGKTAFVTNAASGTVSTIDVKTREKDPTDIAVGTGPLVIRFTPNGKLAFVSNPGSNSVSSIDVKKRTKDPTDIPVGTFPAGMAVTPNGKTLWVANAGLSFFSPGTGGVTVSTVDVKTRKNQRDDITAGTQPTGSRLHRTVRPPSSRTSVAAQYRRSM